jgi:TPR repeat protein
MYEKGLGVIKDETEAAKWYRKAADQGYVSAQSSLGGMYAEGGGVIKDEVRAYMWFLIAGSNGNEIAKANFGKMERWLTAQQRGEGQRMAREWKYPARSTVCR